VLGVSSVMIVFGPQATPSSGYIQIALAFRQSRTTAAYCIWWKQAAGAECARADNPASTPWCCSAPAARRAAPKDWLGCFGMLLLLRGDQPLSPIQKTNSDLRATRSELRLNRLCRRLKRMTAHASEFGGQASRSGPGLHKCPTAFSSNDGGASGAKDEATEPDFRRQHGRRNETKQEHRVTDGATEPLGEHRPTGAHRWRR